MTQYVSPLRYPGGKQKLAPFILEIMKASGLTGGDYAEPYAGGAGVGITMLLSGKAAKIHINDASLPVYAFWKSILTKTEQFCRRISTVSLTVKEWEHQRQILQKHREFRQFDVGFSLFYLNRCNRSGIPTGGLIGGLKQDGKWRMDARFPRNELIRRIEVITEHRNRIVVKNWDAERFLTEYVAKLPAKTLIYCDPPYYHKADRLYLNHYNAEDHAQVAKTIKRIKRQRWVVSYDNAREIRQHYRDCRSFTYDLQYNAGNVYKGREVFFFSSNVKLPLTSNVKTITKGLRRIPLVLR